MKKLSILTAVCLTFLSAACFAGSNGILSNSHSTGGGTPGGTSGQIQYNNSGAFGGISPFHEDFFEWQYNSNTDNAIGSQADSLFTMLAEVHGPCYVDCVNVYAAGDLLYDNAPTYNNGTAGVGATLTAVDNGVFTLDGVSPPLNSIVLLITAPISTEAGVYKVTDAGSVSTPYVLTRDADWDTPAEINEDIIGFFGYKIFVALNGNSKQYAYYLRSGPVTTIGVDSITYQTITNINGMTPMDGLTSGKFYVGNSSAVAAQVSMSGDATMDNAGVVSLKPLISKNTKFTTSGAGCTVASTLGGATAGQFTANTTGTCTTTITMNGATGSTAPNGWTCWASDITTGVAGAQTASSATTATIAIATTSGNTVNFGCMGY